MMHPSFKLDVFCEKKLFLFESLFYVLELLMKTGVISPFILAFVSQSMDVANGFD